MLDHTLPASYGFDTFISVRMHAPRVPIILLSRANDEDLAVRALQHGAQDCLVKSRTDGSSICKSIRYAIERHRVMAGLEETRQQEYMMAYFDSLTGLPNRQLFLDRLSQSLSHAQRYTQKVALFFLDLDGFKDVNDSMGHDCGDELLKVVALRLKDCLRKSDTVARLGGDEFTCILPNIKNRRDVAIVANKIINALTTVFEFNGQSVYISASLGVSIFPNDTEDMQTLIINSDRAMYRAKKAGKNNFQFFSTDLDFAGRSLHAGGGKHLSVRNRKSSADKIAEQELPLTLIR